MTEHKSKVGKNLISMLMFQMYGDSKLIYREYIQNSRDAINDAVQSGVLSKITDGRISITINKTDKIITIEDNGTGVSIDKVEPVLLDIADSSKDGETSAGQFGIGRLVGGYFCKKLSFKTSFKGENKASEIVFDIDKIKNILDDDSDHSTATEVIDKTTDLKLYEEEASKHYFIVTLENIHPDYPELLDECVISDYLKEVAPVDYSVPFKNQLVDTCVHDEYRDLHQKVGFFQISVNNGISLKKKYGLKIEGTGDDILRLEYFKFEDEKYGLLAWGWYANTPFSKQIPVSDKNSCFRLRKHNIQVGDANILTQYFPKNETRGNKYFYGEIHIVNPKIKLNSARDGLAPTPESEKLKSFIRDKFDELVKLYHLANEIKNVVRDINTIEKEEKLTPEKQEEKNIVLDKLYRKEKSKNAQSVAAKQVIEHYKQQVIASSIETGSDMPQSDKSNIVSTNNLLKPTDPYESLKEVMSNSDIEITKRIFDLLFAYCPKRHRDLLEELRKKVVKDLA
jgi:molecular chaperone HtpG